MIGTVIEDIAGRTYRVLRELGAGAEGTVYAVEDERTLVQMTVKVCDPTAITPVTVPRLDAICRLQLSAKSQAICAPICRLHDRHGVGVIQPLANGVALSTLLEQPSYSFQDGIMIATALSRVLSRLEHLGVGHGDLAPNNIFAHRNGKHFEVYLIDLSNAVIPGAPKPTFLGQEYYLAPEVALTDSAPTLESDRFAFATIVHLLLLLRHPFSAVPEANQDAASYLAFLKSASWVEDPMAPRVVTQSVGRTVGVLSRDVQALFRSALEVDPKRRPTFDQWTTRLETSLHNLHACDVCGQSFINEKTRVRCPCCLEPAPSYAFQVNGKSIPLSGTYTKVGREEIGGDMTVSREHVVFERQGFALVVRCLSDNGIAVQTDRGWVELKRGEEVDLSPGASLRIAYGVEGAVCPIDANASP